MNEQNPQHRPDPRNPHGAWQPPAGPVMPGHWQPPAPLPRNGFGTAALVLGLFALATALIPFFWLPALGMALAAVGFGAAGLGRVRRGHATNRRTTIAGLVVGTGATVLAVIGAVIFFNATSQFLDDMDELADDLGGTSTTAPPTVEPAELPSLYPHVEPEPATAGFGPGTYLVGSEIEPGTYRSGGPTSGVMPYCYWARLSSLDGEFDSLIANDGGDGPSLVTIQPGDRAFETSGCEPFERVE